MERPEEGEAGKRKGGSERSQGKGTQITLINSISESPLRVERRLGPSPFFQQGAGKGGNQRRKTETLF